MTHFSASAGGFSTPAATVLAQAQQSTDRYWLVYLLFIVAGLLVGGAYSAYQARSKKLTYLLAVLAAVALAAGLAWMIGEMT
ncbi:hypothetical protein [Corynebacterium epidermidicanis]|uniref:Uncharacterized protein n=1 Tax=Corynebacterium epidermidicanis TaxID=1050174 RepID=A0A0G3GQJ3_9CORY|nr:hypothetical protein [Corynebacterium epidermidicanis]AKK03471.1 hypothetical protein CEPID_08105 [Corynebacterium epidermidicanis]